jgi:hypothetical protein
MVVLTVGNNVLKRIWSGLKIRRGLRRAGIKQYRDFHCPDGMGGQYTVDRLILRPDGISVLLYMRYEGNIFCGENIDHWTQMIGGKSYSFTNPLTMLDYQVAGVKALVPGIDVDGYLFFDHRAHFPKGKAERVIQLDNMPDSLLNRSGRPDDKLMSAWKKLRP